MSAVGASELEMRRGIERSPDVYFVLCEDGAQSTLLGTLYKVLLPQDADRFRLWDDGEGFDVMFKLRGRWHRVDAAWWQMKGRDQAENRPVSIVTFGRRILAKRHGVKEWKPKK